MNLKKMSLIVVLFTIILFIHDSFGFRVIIRFPILRLQDYVEVRTASYATVLDIKRSVSQIVKIPVEKLNFISHGHIWNNANDIYNPEEFFKNEMPIVDVISPEDCYKL